LSSVLLLSHFSYRRIQIRRRR